VNHCLRHHFDIYQWQFSRGR